MNVKVAGAIFELKRLNSKIMTPQTGNLWGLNINNECFKIL